MIAVEPIWFTIQQAAQITGLSEDTLKRAIHAKKNRLKAKKTGQQRGKYLLRKADLEKWFDGLVDA